MYPLAKVYYIMHLQRAWNALAATKSYVHHDVPKVATAYIYFNQTA